MEHISITSRERLFSPTSHRSDATMTAEVWASETYAILEWQESSSDSDLLLMDIRSEQSNLPTASYSCH